MEKLVSGVARFQASAYEERRHLFAELATGQSPEVLFITSADSRIDPNLVTQTEPGDLFICRNAGNIVPPYRQGAGGETATIEFAVAALGVKHIVVCGHTDCGAMKGALNPQALSELPQVGDWLDHARAAVDIVKTRYGRATLEELLPVIEQNVLQQLQHLRTHPVVASRINNGELMLHGWVYDIETGVVTCHDDDADCFVPIEQHYSSLLAEAS